MALALPVSVENLFQMALVLADQIVVGGLGAVAIAAVGMTASVLFLTTITLSAIGAGTAIVVSHHYGRGEFEAIGRIAIFAIGASIAIAAVLAILIVPFSNPILRLLGLEHEAVRVGAPYFSMSLLSLIPALGCAVISSIVRALGRPMVPLLITVPFLALNTALGAILVYGIGGAPKLGLAGAGIATIVTQSGRLVVLLIILIGFKLPWDRRLSWRKLTRHIGPLFKLSGPLALSELVWAAGLLVYNMQFAATGTTGLAASQITIAIENVFMVVFSGLPVAGVIMIGRSLGIGATGVGITVAKRLMVFGATGALVSSLLLVLFPQLLPFLYPSVEQATLLLAGNGLLFVAFIQPLRVLNMIIGNGILPSGGDTRYILVVDFCSTFVFGIPAAFLLGFELDFGMLGIFGGKAIEEMIRLLLLYLRFQGGAWFKLAALNVVASPSGESRS